MAEPSIRSVFIAPALLLCLLVGGACDRVEFEPRTLVNRMRVLAVRAEPPALGFGGKSQLSMKVVTFEGDEPLCHAWAFCLMGALQQTDNLSCLDDDLLVPLGVAPEATVTFAQVMETFGNVGKVMEKLGLNPPEDQLAQDKPDEKQCPEDGEKPLDFNEFPIYFKVAAASEFGGTCPTDPLAMLAPACTDRKHCVGGFKVMRIALKQVTKDCKTSILPDSFALHANPKLVGITMEGVDWPQGLVPTLAPVKEDDTVTAGPPDSDKRGVELIPKLSEDSIEVLYKSKEPGLADPTERIVFSWLSTAGRFSYGRSSDKAPDTRFRAAPLADNPDGEVRIWVVVRDGRGGVDWLERKVKVGTPLVGDDGPLCALDGTLEGCQK